MDGKKRKSHQQSAACTIRKKSKSEITLKMMSDADKDLLNLNRVTLMEGIDLTGSTILAGLRARGVITVHQEQVFKTERGDINQVGVLLDGLLRGDEDTLDNFNYALRKSGHTALAETTLGKPRKPDKFADTPDAVVVAYKDDKFEVELEEDGTLLVSTINSQLEPGHTAKGLRYTHTANGLPRAVPMREGKFSPPKQGWSKRVYTVVPGGDEQNKSSVKPTSAGNQTEENGVKDESKGSTPAAGQSAAVNSTAEN